MWGGRTCGQQEVVAESNSGLSTRGMVLSSVVSSAGDAIGNSAGHAVSFAIGKQSGSIMRMQMESYSLREPQQVIESQASRSYDVGEDLGLQQRGTQRRIEVHDSAMHGCLVWVTDRMWRGCRYRFAVLFAKVDRRWWSTGLIRKMPLIISDGGAAKGDLGRVLKMPAAAGQTMETGRSRGWRLYHSAIGKIHTLSQVETAKDNVVTREAVNQSVSAWGVSGFRMLQRGMAVGSLAEDDDHAGALGIIDRCLHWCGDGSILTQGISRVENLRITRFFVKAAVCVGCWCTRGNSINSRWRVAEVSIHVRGGYGLDCE